MFTVSNTKMAETTNRNKSTRAQGVSKYQVSIGRVTCVTDLSANNWQVGKHVTGIAMIPSAQHVKELDVQDDYDREVCLIRTNRSRLRLYPASVLQEIVRNV